MALSIDRVPGVVLVPFGDRHPPIGVFPDRRLVPVNYLRTSFPWDEVLPVLPHRELVTPRART
jgi:hypothetical protein